MRSMTRLMCVAAVGFGAIMPAAFAQPDQKNQPPAGERPGGGGPGGGQRASMSPEALKAAWTLQATGVARRVGTSDDKAKEVVKAYTAARESHEQASEKLRKEMLEKMRGGDGKGDGKAGDGPRGGGMGPEFMKAMDEVNAAEREKLKKALASSLTAEQTDKAIASLGLFFRQWDGMANVVAGFNLEPAKLQEASNAMEDYAVAINKMRASAGGGAPDPGAMREAIQQSRAKVQDAMKKVLTEEQFKSFERTLGGPMRGQGGGPKEP